MRPRASGPAYDLARTHAALGDRKQVVVRAPVQTIGGSSADLKLEKTVRVLNWSRLL
jgi:hypothetical protein